MACKPTTIYVPTGQVKRVVTETVYTDTVIVTQVPETYAERVTTDTVSELSTPFAYSRAEVSGGRLTHSLGTHGELPTSVRIEEKIITIRDSIPYPVEVEVIREVAKPLRWWQRSLMWIGGIVILSVAAYVGIKIYRR